MVIATSSMSKKTNCQICDKNIVNLYTVNSLHSEEMDNKYHIDYCDNCQIGYTMPFGISNDYYSDDNYGYDRFKAQKNEKNFRNNFYKKITRKYANEKVLDVGCMFGDFLLEIKNEYNVSGVELSKEPSDYVNNISIPCFNGTIEEFSKNNKQTFDTITSFHCLEHTTNAMSFFSSVREILKDDGVVIISVPNFRKNQFFGRFWGWILAPAHQYHFSSKSLKIIAKKNNFEIIDVKKVGGDASFFISSIYNLLGIKGGKKINIKLFTIVHNLTYWFFSRFWFYIGSEEVVLIAKKKN